MTLGERIKKARRELNLTQQKFADQIGTTQNNIASYEIGRREPSAAAINNICKTFGISESWLRTGEGDMLTPKSEEEELRQAVESMLKGRNPNFKRRLIAVLASLDEDDWLILEEKAVELARAARPDSVPTLAILQQKQEAEEKADFLAMAGEQFDLEKKQESQASSVKGYGAI